MNPRGRTALFNIKVNLRELLSLECPEDLGRFSATEKTGLCFLYVH